MKKIVKKIAAFAVIAALLVTTGNFGITRNEALALFHRSAAVPQRKGTGRL